MARHHYPDAAPWSYPDTFCLYKYIDDHQIAFADDYDHVFFDTKEEVIEEINRITSLFAWLDDIEGIDMKTGLRLIIVDNRLWEA